MMKKYCGLFQSTYKNRLKNTRMFKILIAQRIENAFSTMLEERHFKGQLCFNHRDNQLDLHVQPQADASEQNDMRQLSGGERSFSTVCFILALWEAMVSPFRCLDEFDVFMDNVNRALSMKMIMKTAQKHQDQQFIFLTPLDMSHMEGHRGIKTFQMPDPHR